MIAELTEDEFASKAGSIVRRIFKTPFDAAFPFTDALPLRALFYPTSYALTDRQVEAVVRCARVMGDDRGFLWFVEGDISFREFDLRPSEVLDAWSDGWENVLFGPSGRWAVFQTQDNMSIVGGDAEFMECLRRSYPDLDADGVAYVGESAAMALALQDMDRGLLEFLAYVFGSSPNRS